MPKKGAAGVGRRGCTCCCTSTKTRNVISCHSTAPTAARRRNLHTYQRAAGRLACLEGASLARARLGCSAAAPPPRACASGTVAGLPFHRGGSSLACLQPRSAPTTGGLRLAQVSLAGGAATLAPCPPAESRARGVTIGLRTRVMLRISRRAKRGERASPDETVNAKQRFSSSALQTTSGWYFKCLASHCQ